jgi:hypothetical protein
MTWPGLAQDVELGLFMIHLSNISNYKEGAKEIWVALTQNSGI